jgi:LacI family transcriptional regulator
MAEFDDTPIAVNIWTSLTTVKHPGKAISAQSATLAVSLARGDREDIAVPTEQCLEHRLAVRESTATPVSKP